MISGRGALEKPNPLVDSVPAAAAGAKPLQLLPLVR